MEKSCFRPQPLFSQGKIYQYALKKTPREAQNRPRFFAEKASCYGGESIYNFAVVLSAAASMSRTYGFKFCISLHSLRRRWELLRRSDPARASKEPCKESFTSAAQCPIFFNIYHRNHHHDGRWGNHGGESYTISSGRNLPTSQRHLLLRFGGYNKYPSEIFQHAATLSKQNKPQFTTLIG